MSANLVTRMSDSRLWDLQRRYFAAQGPAAWSTGTVPHYVTCNPFLARAYADVILGFARDLRGQGERPLYIVELGAGSGRLGYALVRALRALALPRRLGVRPVYVLTDLAERTVAWWQQHAWLRPLADAGLLDFARFDVEHDRQLTLRESGRTLSPERPADQLVVVANYVFDGLPHDVFHCANGALSECLVELALPDGDVERDGLGDLELRYQRRPAPARCYRDPVRQRILDDYTRTIEHGTITMPTAAIDALDQLRRLSSGPVLVLSADKGSAHLDKVVELVEPTMAVHGSVSAPVNYHAIGAWVTAHGGVWMHAAHHDRAIDVCSFVLGADREPIETTAAFDRSIAQRGPDDFYTLKTALEYRYQTLSFGQLLAYLRFSGFDPKLFHDALPTLFAGLPGATELERIDLADAIVHAWDGYLPIGEDRNLAYGLGVLAAGIGRLELARELFEASIVLHGEDAATCFQLARCELAAGAASAAEVWLERAQAHST